MTLDTRTDTTNGPIAFQGHPGAYSHLACQAAFPQRATLPCATFEEAFAAVRDQRAAFAVMPIENSQFGRVADMHHLLPEGGLHIIAEHFQPVDHCLLALPGATIDGLTEVHSHVQALGQCRRSLQALGLQPVISADTAGAAEWVAQSGRRDAAAVASALAAEIYGLEILRHNLQDAPDNTTRFLILAAEAVEPDPAVNEVITSFVFKVRNIPAALYKALGGFATNGVNLTKLESYMLDGKFQVSQFYADIDGRPSEPLMRLAFEELGFFARDVRILGVYPAHPFRRDGA